MPKRVQYVGNHRDWRDVEYPGATWLPETTAHRVHRTARASVYVEDPPALIERIDHGVIDHELQSFVLDRQELACNRHAASRTNGR